MIGRCLIALVLCAWLALPQAAMADSTQQLEIHGASPELKAYISTSVENTSPRLQAWTGRKPTRIVIHVHGSQASFARQMDILGAPSWADGLALPRSGQIHIKSPALLAGVAEFDHVLSHELMHLHLATTMGGRSLPLWLEEGLAVLLSGESGWRRGSAMARGVLMGQLPSLAELADHFPADHADAAEAYAVSYFFVSWFLENYGDKAMRDVISGLGQGLTTTAAFRRATGISLAKLEKQFNDAMEDRFSWFGLLADSGVFWSVIAVLAALALIIAYRRQKNRRRTMDGPDRELLHVPPGRVWPPPTRRTDVLSEAGQRHDDHRPSQ